MQLTGKAAQVQAKVAELHCGGHSAWAEHAAQLTGVAESPRTGHKPQKLNKFSTK